MTKLEDSLTTPDIDHATVWVVTVSHQYGIDSEIYDCEDCAKNRLLDYVQAWWHKLDSPGLIPLDREEAITAYFDQSREWACVMAFPVRTHHYLGDAA